jgi:glycosyltransferase involved in cell wall biosynthesis
MHTLGAKMRRDKMKEIAVIMPVYKAHDTIQQTLSSIEMQKASDYKVYLVVDGEEEGSYDYLKERNVDLDIFYMEENGGPGVARQYGIDNTEEPFISFMDADDTYFTSLALYYQHLPLKEDTVAMVSCDFAQEKKDHTIKIMENDMVWMHGKMYRREFLDKNNIRFNDTRANEDVGFNTQCQCYANEKEQVYLSKDITYLWQWRDDSTVRADNAAYAFNQSIDGFVVNKIYAFQSVLEQKEIDDAVKYLIIKGQMALFKKYLVAMLRYPKRLNHVKKWARKYYRTLYKLIDQEYIDKAEQTIMAQTGLEKQDQYDEYVKWKDQLSSKKRKKKVH